MKLSKNEFALAAFPNIGHLVFGQSSGGYFKYRHRRFCKNFLLRQPQISSIFKKADRRKPSFGCHEISNGTHTGESSHLGAVKSAFKISNGTHTGESSHLGAVKSAFKIFNGTHTDKNSHLGAIKSAFKIFNGTLSA